MKSRQHLSILFYLNRKKATRKGIPIYIRLTIDGEESELSLGKKVRTGYEWDNEKKRVTGDGDDAIEINTAIADARKEINSHFTVLCAAYDNVTPEMLKASYKPKAAECRSKHTMEEYLSFSKRLNDLITDYLQYLKNVRDEESNEEQRGKWEWLAVIGAHGLIIKERIEAAVEAGNNFFDDKLFRKTLLVSIDESLLHLLRNVQGEKRSFQTLRRWRVTKNKLFAFCRHRYKRDDLFLDEVRYPLADQLYTYLTLDDDLAHNSAMKHIKNTKQIFDRVVTLEWIPSNPIKQYKCTYIDPDREALTMHHITTLVNHKFKSEKLETVRDCFIFACFTGYAYQDLRRLGPEHIITGVDGKKWLSLNRGKTDVNEAVPMLPIVEAIVEKYRKNKLCTRRKKLLPIASNQKFNDYIQEVVKECGFEIYITSHYARHTFATTIALENDVPLEVVQALLGLKNIATARVYAKTKRTAVSRNMQRIEELLFDGNGELKELAKQQSTKKPLAPQVAGLRIAYVNGNSCL